MSANNLSFEGQVDHLKTCYENEQSVIRFLDTKVTAALTATFTLGGLVAAFVKWSLTGFTCSLLSSGCGYLGLFSVLTVSVAYALYLLVRIILDAFACINPETTKNEGCSTLFLPVPLSGEWRSEAISHIKLMTSLSETKQENILSDYEKQLLRVGEILDKKASHCKSTITRLKGYLFSLVTVAVLSGLCFLAIGNTATKQPTETKLHCSCQLKK